MNGFILWSQEDDLGFGQSLGNTVVQTVKVIDSRNETISLSYDDLEQPIQTLLDDYISGLQQADLKQLKYYLINTDTATVLSPGEPISAYLSILKQGRVKLVPQQMWVELQKQQLTQSQIRNSYLNGQLTLIATDGSSHLIRPVQSTLTLAQLKQRIQTQLGIPSDRCKLFIGQDQLFNNQWSLSRHRIPNQSTIRLAVTYDFAYPQEDSVIASSMSLEVCSSNKKAKVKVTPWTSVHQLKQILQQEEGIAVHQQTLFCHNRQLQDRNCLMDYGIKANSIVHLMIRRLGGCFHRDSLITRADGKQVKIDEARIGDRILTYNTVRGALQEDDITGLHKVSAKFSTVIEMEEGRVIECTPQDLLLTAEGEWKKCERETDKSFLKVGEKLIVFQEGQLRSSNILAIRNDQRQSEQFIHLSIRQNHNFIVNGLIAHNMQIHIKTLTSELLTLDMQPSDTILAIKQKTQEILSIPPKLQKLYYAGRQLQNDKTISDYALKKNSTLSVIYRLPGLSFSITITTPDSQLVIEDMSENTKVDAVMRAIRQKKGITITEQQLIYCNLILEADQTLGSYKIREGAKIQLEILSRAEPMPQEEPINEYTSTLTMVLSDSQNIEVSYGAIRSKTVCQALSELLPDSKSHYCLLYGQEVIEPHQPVFRIEDNPHFRGDRDDQVFLLRTVQKMLFYKRLIPNAPFDLKHYMVTQQFLALKEKSNKIIQKSHDLAAKFKQESFFTPIQYYTYVFSEMNRKLRQLDFADEDYFVSKDFGITSALIDRLSQLPNYTEKNGLIHRGIAGFNFSDHQKVGDVFHWKSFTSCSTTVNSASKFRGVKGTLFHIHSLSGKFIYPFSVYRYEKEVILLPFTYFMVERIVQRKGENEEVWLTQMQSPYAFRGNLVVWVDDQPENNRAQVEACRKEGKAEVVQLTSTAMAVKWAGEFAWLLTWMGARTKVITDMVRVEEGQGLKSHRNLSAGVDLMEAFYRLKGYSIPITIYCSDVDRARQTAKDRGIPPSRIGTVTSSEEVILHELNF